VLREPFLPLCLVFLAVADVSGGQAVVRQDAAGNAQSNRSGAWSARTTSGLTLMGTWTAVPDSTGGTVTGTWTLADAQGRSVASGAWSAAKAPARWTGVWRAVVAGRDGERSGTWTAGVDLAVNATFVDLFEKAVQTVVSGNWRAGSQSGAWSISGIVLWLAFAIAALILMAIGLHTPQAYLKSSALYLVAALVSSLVGAAVYKE